MYTIERFEQQIRAALAFTGLIDAEDVDLAVPKAKGTHADLALPCFRAAKAQQKNPAEFAQALASAVQIPADSLIETVTAAGPYLNFTLKAGLFAHSVLSDINQRNEAYGCSDYGANSIVIVEYSSPNVAKRMHVGHIRSTIIGQAIANLYTCMGYEVVRDNHLGDYGKQFGVNIAAVQKFGRPTGTGEAALAELEAKYTQYNTLMAADTSEDFDPDSDSSLDDEARSWSLKLEQNDPEAVELWQWMVDLTKTANQRNYDRLAIRFDTQHGESFYKELLPTVIETALEQQLAEREADGSVVVQGLHDTRGKELPLFLLQRSDGGTLYITRDLATVKYRETTYDPHMMIYIVGQPQELHFRQTFALAQQLGYTDAELVHVQFGTVFDTTGKPLSTRKGNMVYLEALLDEAARRAKSLIEEKVAEGKTNLSSEQIDAVAEMVGVGAVIYNDLYQDTKRNITLDWERMLAFEGNSAPYLQYMHARCCSILREAGELAAGYDGTLLAAEAEQNLIKELARLPQVVLDAGQRFAPFMIADWLYSTARAFSAFYDACPVLKAEPALRAARLQLVHATAQALRNGLGLLAIQAPQQM